ncbi:hypothetical protein ACHQM5_028164 [Ranunculus cassubicifolius]
MTGGSCKDIYQAWEDCLRETSKDKGDVAEKCSKATLALTQCIEANSDYYSFINDMKNEEAEEATKSYAENNGDNRIKDLPKGENTKEDAKSA